MKLTKILLTFIAALTTTSAFAAGGTDVGIFFGMKNTTFDSDTAGSDFSTKAGLMGGILAYNDMGAFTFRTGAYYAVRATKVDVGAASADLSASYIDIPVTAQYQFNEMLGAFAGPLFALKATDNCKGDSNICSGSDDYNSMYSALTLGLNAKFHPNWSGEIFYEHGLSDLADHISANAISLGAVFIY